MQFKAAYDQLNTEQKKAVDATDGAVLVIAGPGTGKTQLLSLRVANILNTTDALPHNVLCLTFTNKASSNMQLRLSKLVGSLAQKVMIKTFHGFAAEIMQMYPDFFWNGARLSNVPDAVQLEIITDILSALPLDNPLALKFAGQYTSTNAVLDALRLAKEAGLTPDKLRALIGLNMSYIDKIEPELIDICSERLNYKILDELAMRVEELPEQNTDDVTRPLISLSTVIQESFETAHTADEGTNRTKNTSAWKSRWIKNVEGVKAMHDERARNTWWLAVADVYESYRDRLHKAGYYDYSDMIIEVISQIEKQPDMRASIQEQFQYVLIDEFQDTNAAQLRLAHLVADHSVSEGNPNIMAVGDDDQSIYKFNGAELSNMLGFTRSYPLAKVFVLTDNYRSTQDVLDFSKRIIEQASERVTTKNSHIVKELIAKTSPAGTSYIEHIAYPTKEYQYHGIAAHISKMRQKSPGTTAVLARGHESLRHIAQALKAINVPVRYEQQQSIFELPLVQQLTYICEILVALQAGDEPRVNMFMPLLLSAKAWRIDPYALWQLALTNRHKPAWIESLVTSDQQNLQAIGHWLLWLAQESAHEPLGRILEYTIGLNASEHLTSPLRHYFLEANEIDTPYLANISAVKKLLGLAHEFGAHDLSTTKDFVRLLQVARENKRTITDESLFVTANDAVELLTIHKAKGLEYDSIYILDAMEAIWKPSHTGRKPPSNLPLRPSGDTYDDYIRLLFVAATRAKQNIFISSYYTNDQGDESIASSIIRDILPARIIGMDETAEPVQVLESFLSWPRLDGSAEQALLKNILESYTLSPTAFLDFLDVNKGGPHYFLEKHLLRLPEAQSTAAAFGNAMHAALEAAQQAVVDNRFSLDVVYTAFEYALRQQLLNAQDHERYNEHGQKVLSRLFKDYNFALERNGKPEVSLQVHIGEALLSGKLDRIDEQGNTITVTDYKTGTPLSSLATKNKLLEMKAWRHRTQLELYILMLKQSDKYDGKKFVAQMMYVEAESKKDLIKSYEAASENLERLEKLVEVVYDKIQTLNLPDTRHYSEGYAGVASFIEDLLTDKI